MSFFRRTLGKFWILILIGVMLTVFLTIATSKKNLDVYTKKDSTYTMESEVETEEDIETELYQNQEAAFTMEVPTGWNYVKKDGYDTYVHSASATSIQFQLLNYYPQVNNATQESLAQTYVSQGMNLIEFAYTANNSYYTICQKQGNTGVTDYIQTVVWDRQHVMKVVITLNDQNYDKLSNTIWHCIDSIQWKYEDPIPEGFYLYYQSMGDFEYAVPAEWITGNTENTFYAYDEKTNAKLSVSLIEDTSSINEISQLDYSNFAANGRSNFALTKYEQSDNSIYGEATYLSSDLMMSMMQYYIANGTYHYILTYEYPTELGAEFYDTAQKALKYTRVFYVTQTDSQSEDPGNIEEMPEANGFYDKYLQGEAETSKNVSFADALISITGISKEKSDEIVGLWAELGLSSPTYVEISEQISEKITIFIQGSNNQAYFLVMTRLGNPISINLENGSVLWSAD